MTASTALPMLVPEWSAPAGVQARVTLRDGGVGVGAYGRVGGLPGGLNLGEHVGDDPATVAANRARVAATVPAPIRWLEQVHGTVVHDADTSGVPASPPVADAAVATRPGVVLAVMTADCLPIVLAEVQGAGVGVAHAGWRGLSAGVIERTVEVLRARVGETSTLRAWLGPAIGPMAFQVGDDVRDAFCDLDRACADAFAPDAVPGKWRADLYRLARRRLAASGVVDVTGGGLCTVSDPARFWSHRRDRRSGRFASLVWLSR